MSNLLPLSKVTRFVDMPHPDEKDMRIVGVVVPASAQLGDCYSRMDSLRRALAAAAPPPDRNDLLGGQGGRGPGAPGTQCQTTVADRARLPEWWSRFIQNVCEIPDRTSPDDEPEALVATEAELVACALRAIESRPIGALHMCDSKNTPIPHPAEAWRVPKALIEAAHTLTILKEVSDGGTRQGLIAGATAFAETGLAALEHGEAPSALGDELGSAHFADDKP